jgi:phosphoribosylformimino-5-aminoimidazole carboxamide ribotide isomerase
VEIFPAIDLRGGKVVRLRQGDPARQTVYSDDPLEVAQRWQAEGARWLHVVNLDGAFSSSASSRNVDAIQSIARACPLPVQLGGGLRSVAAIRAALELGIARVVLGTLAVQAPEIVRDAVRTFGADRIVAGLDAKDGMLTTHGWQAQTALSVIDAALRMKELGVERVVFTDIGRDGMLQGVNIEATRTLACDSGLRVIASGGVASLDDIDRLKAIESDGVEGVIIGQALYTGAVRLSEAIHVSQTNHLLPRR